MQRRFEILVDIIFVPIGCDFNPEGVLGLQLSNLVRIPATDREAEVTLLHCGLEPAKQSLLKSRGKLIKGVNYDVPRNFGILEQFLDHLLQGLYWRIVCPNIDVLLLGCLIPKCAKHLSVHLVAVLIVAISHVEVQKLGLVLVF